MNIWLKRLHITLTIGGGFLGLALTLQVLFAANELSPFAYTMYAAFTGLYAYAIFAGFRLIENEANVKHLLVFYALQIPWISTPIIGYRFTSGFNITGGIFGLNLSGFFRLGSDWQFNLNQKIPWGIGINVFALIMLIILVNQKRPIQTQSPTVESPDPTPIPE